MARLVLVLTPLLLVGCIFSPDEKKIPPPPLEPIDSPEALVNALARSYRTRNIQLFQSLFANEEDHGVEYLFLYVDEETRQQQQWGFKEEVRIHRRMFEPQNPDPGETPVIAALWLQEVTITLEKQSGFDERPDLLSTQPGDGKLDPDRWNVKDAHYVTNLFFKLQGDTDYIVNGEANYVVIEDLTKEVGDDGKFLFYIWEDLDTKPIVAKPPA